MNRTIIYINPQSMRNLSIYDYGVMSEYKYNVIYICSKYYDYKKPNDNVTQLKLFKYNKISNPILKLLSYIQSLIKIFRVVLSEKPDVIHIQWFRVPLIDFFFYSLLKTTTRARIVYTAHNILPHNSGKKYFKIFKQAYNMFDKIIVHTQRTKEEICCTFNIPQNRINIIRHGLLEMTYDKQLIKNNEQTYFEEYKIKDKIVFISLGEQSPYKGIDMLAKIWADTPELRNNLNIVLILAGKQKAIDLPSVKDIENIIVKNKSLSNEEFMFLLHHADVYLLPYRIISQSGALLTVLNEKVPVLVSNVGGLTDPFNIAEIGWIIPANDPSALKDKLIYLTKRPEEIARIKNNKEDWNNIAVAYDWKTISNETLKVYFKD